jgi:LPXTG-motif cell wall-anchored protein
MKQTTTTRVAGVGRMKRVATAAMAGLVILLAGLVGFAPAQAAVNCSIPEGDSGDPLVVKICIEPAFQKVEERHNFSVEAKVVANNKGKNLPNFHCSSLTYEYQSKTNTSGKFTAPSVKDDVYTTVTATCNYDDTQVLGGGGTGRLATVSLASAIKSASAQASVLVTDHNGNGSGGKKHHKNKDDDDDNGNLPNTGGERLAWLVIGLLLVAAGSTVVVSSRKRDSVA